MPDEHLDTGTTGNRFLRNSLKAAWASRQAEEELELEEFRALETQIKADVVGAARARPDHGGQVGWSENCFLGFQALPSSTVTLAPSAPLRSYAAIHQQRPPQPSHGAPRTNSRGSDPQARTHAACASPRPAGRHRYNDAFVGGAAVDADDELAGSFGEQAGGEAPGGDEGSAWGQQQQQQPLSPGKSGAASVAGKVGGTRGFDDADAWNDTSSFFGGGTTAVGGVRKGAAAAAAAGANGNRAPLRGSAFFGRQSQSPASAAQLDDPWAAPAIGDEQYGTSQEAFLDDCSGWSADQQQKLQPQPLSQKGAGDEERGPDQPFVRALFSKPQRQTMQNGGSRTVVKGTAGKSRAAATAAAEPSGPSAAELEKMQQVLEEQLANVASERSTLVRMRTELEKAANRLEQERQAWEKTRAEEQAKWEAQREAEEGKLRRDRRVLEKQSKALLKLPNKKERTAMEAAEAALEAERREGRAREARHKLTVERLRRQLVELQGHENLAKPKVPERNQELREEVRWHEAQQLERGWGCPAGAATGGGASAGAKGAGPGAAPPPAKPRPGRTIAVQTEPLAFLPPLECVGAGHRADGGPPAVIVAGSRTKSSGMAAPSVGGRLRGMQTVGRGHADASVGAVQPAQPTSWRAERAAVRKSGSPLQWQASVPGNEGDEGRESGVGGAGDGGEEAGPTYYGHDKFRTQRCQKQLRSQRELRGLGARPDSPSSSLLWQQGREQAYDVGDEYDTGCGGEVDAEEDLGEVEDGEAELLGGAARCGGAGGGGRDGVYVGWRRGGACAPSGPGSPSSYSYVQNDDVEVLTDEAAGPDGAYSDSVSAVAWRQHQDFMNRVGLEPGDGRRPGPPPAGSESPRQGRRAFPGAAGPRQQQQQQQGQQRQQPLPPPWGRAGDADASSAQEFSSTHQRPGTSDRLSRPPELQQQDQHQHQHQHQQQQQQTVWQAYGPGGGQQSSRQSGSAGRPAAAASSMPPQLATDLRGGPAPWEEAYPDQEAATREPLPGSSQGGPAASPPGSPRWAAHGAPPGPGPGAGKGATAPRVFFGPRGSEAAPAAARTRGGIPPAAGQTSGPTSATAPAPVVVSMAVSTGSGRSAGHGSPARPSSPLRGSLAELDGVSQTLAALRMDRRVEAAAAAAAAGGGSTANGAPAAWPGVPSLGRPPHFAAATGQAQSQAGPGSGLQRGLGSQRPGAGSPEAGSEGGWPGDVWSPRSRGGPARESAKSQQPSSVAPMAWGPGPTHQQHQQHQQPQVALLDGSSRVYFSNGDIKWSIPSAAAAFRSPAAAAAAGEAPSPPDVAVVHYYYAEVGTWHSTYGGEGGVEVFYFPSGQTEAHHPGYGKEIMFPDGVLRVVTTDGEELDIGWPQLSWAVQQPQPRVDDLASAPKLCIPQKRCPSQEGRNPSPCLGKVVVAGRLTAAKQRVGLLATPKHPIGIACGKIAIGGFLFLDRTAISRMTYGRSHITKRLRDLSFFSQLRKRPGPRREAPFGRPAVSHPVPYSLSCGMLWGDYWLHWDRWPFLSSKQLTTLESCARSNPFILGILAAEPAS
ncbi:hypothetical protein VOLCADRAFT_86210 [Volvox carteri f. nagariensis]|uniref:Centromere protein J C-terminal domain-containing protein n=1 Tax=Volvox carteri f. nagariensis TaxID=3068 RepID=D8TI67_VOLCA|nr:uncharacterized protein VOLCADRAFT_86210 [Volvox carteri f. nagariensis]EFJ53183.1 hypothetical protein VOLCADRAFT_86210 [Volvox carteri f. nagariensis]|eukprot:XP_002946188.1 hypothetical protein VOLCADRAFT_86210 [Volvox carteri f. nagariensis]